MSNTEDFHRKADSLDSSDPLSGFRKRFFSGTETIYLDGNSLGRLPIDTISLMQQMVEQQWGDRLIRSWNEHWLGLPRRIAGKIARLVGAEEDEIFVGDSTSVNLYKLAYGTLSLQQGRTQILSDDLNFPSDFYVLQGLIKSHFHNYSLNILKSTDGIHAPLDQLEAALNSNTALVCLSHVAFKSAFMHDMARLNKIAACNGTKIIWDLSHAVGSVPLKLNEWGAEMAVGCTYKYLNGGPGAPAFLYVRKDLQPRMESAIWAWFGHARPFEFGLEYEARGDVWKYAAGTPPILSMAAIEPGLDLLLDAGMDALRSKSLGMSAFFYKMYKHLLEPLGFSWASPTNAHQRGSHVSISHPEGYRICKALIAPNDGNTPIIPDFRKPDIIRLGFAPIYNTHTDLAEAVARIAAIVRNSVYLEYDPSLEAVT